MEDEMMRYFAVNVKELEEMTKWLFTHGVTYYIQPMPDYEKNAVVIEIAFRYDALSSSDQTFFDFLFDNDWDAKDVDFSILGVM